MGLRQRIEWILALLWATICANPGWVLSVGLHSCVLAVLSIAVFSSGHGGRGLGIEGGFGDGGGGGGGGGGGDSFETVLDPAGSTLGTTEEPSLQVQAALALQASEEAAAQALEQRARLGLTGPGSGPGVGPGSGPGSGGGSGGGEGGGQGPGIGAAFFGAKGEGKSFVFVVDMSQSMQGERFRRAIAELMSSINKLKPEQKFYVFFFNDKAHPLFEPSPARGMQVATPANKTKANRWIRSREPNSTTDPGFAMQLALEMKPDVIFLLTDGELDDPAEVRYTIRRANKGGTTIHTIAFENEDGARSLETIATDNGGTFRFVK